MDLDVSVAVASTNFELFDVGDFREVRFGNSVLVERHLLDEHENVARERDVSFNGLARFTREDEVLGCLIPDELIECWSKGLDASGGGVASLDRRVGEDGGRYDQVPIS